MQGANHFNTRKLFLTFTLLVVSFFLNNTAFSDASQGIPGQKVDQLQTLVNEAYNKYKDLKEGKNADYIPILATVPSDLFGVAIITREGKVYTAGDVDYAFSIQSVSKLSLLQ